MPYFNPSSADQDFIHFLFIFISTINATFLKQLLGMTSIFVFNLEFKWCIPQIMILFFYEFLDLENYFLSTFLWIRLKPKHTFFILNTW